MEYEFQSRAFEGVIVAYQHEPNKRIVSNTRRFLSFSHQNIHRRVLRAPKDKSQPFWVIVYSNCRRLWGQKRLGKPFFGSRQPVLVWAGDFWPVWVVYRSGAAFPCGFRFFLFCFFGARPPISAILSWREPKKESFPLEDDESPTTNQDPLVLQ